MHFVDLLEREEPTTMEAGIELEVPQRQIDRELDDAITTEEITHAIAKLKSTGPGFSGAHAACFTLVKRFGNMMVKRQECWKAA